MHWTRRYYCNLSPRGDGNKNDLLPVANALLLQFIPARGRKPADGIALVPQRDCNLSPRGDGNRGRVAVSTLEDQLQFIPARGRKPSFWARRLVRSALIAIYPREGTETRRSPFRRSSFRLQFIPARGRKQLETSIVNMPEILQFIPARGRKRIAALRSA